MSQRLTVTAPLAVGVDRGTEPQIAEGNLTAKNAVITRRGSIGKRRGLEAVTGSGYPTEPVLASMDDVPIMVGDFCRQWIGDAADAGWPGDNFVLPYVGRKAYAGLCDVWPEHFVAGNGDHPNFVDIGGDAARGFYVVAMSYDTTTIIYQIDAETGTILFTRSVDLGRFCRVLTTDNAVWYIYIDPSTYPGDIRGGKVTLASGIPTPSVLWNTTVSAAGEFQMDVCHITGDTAVIAFRENAQLYNVQFLAFDASAGSVTANHLHSFPSTGTNRVQALSLIKRPTTTTEVICCATIYDTATPSMWIEAAGVPVAMGAPNWTINNIGTDTTNVRPYDITGIARTDTDVRVYYTVGGLRNPATNAYEWQRRHTKSFTLSYSGSWSAGSPVVMLYHCAIASKPWLDPLSTSVAIKMTHLPAVGSSPAGGSPAPFAGPAARTQPGSTFIVRDYLGDGGTPLCIGKIAIDRTCVCIEDNSAGAMYGWEYWADATQNYDGRVPHVITESTGDLTTVVPVLGSYDILRDRARYTAVGRPTALWTDRITAPRGAGAYVARISYNPDTPLALEARDAAIIPNSCPYECHGSGGVEQGFLWYPEDVKVTTSGSGGISGTFGFAVVACVEDEHGNTHWSAPVFLDSMTVASVQYIVFTIGCITLTRHASIEFYCYRTKDAGSTYYFCGKVTNGYASETVSVSSSTPDSSLQGSGLYTDGGIVEDVQPPPYRVHCMHQGRHFVVHREFEDWLIQYSKEEREKTGIGHNEMFQILVDPDGGRITALASLGDRLVIFKGNRIYATDGYGLNEAAQGGGYARPVLINPQLGCIEQRSIARVPAGLLFLSDAGIQLLDHSLQAHPLGERVKWYTDNYTLAATTPLPEYDSVLFVFSEVASEALVYNWKHDQWTTWLNCAGVDAITIDGRPWLKSVETAVANKVVRQISGETYYDFGDITAPVIRTIETGWFSLVGIADYGKLKEMRLLGYSRTPCTLTVKIAYDYSPVWVDTLTLDTSELAPFGHTEHYSAMATVDVQDALIARLRGSISKCSAVRLQISDA